MKSTPIIFNSLDDEGCRLSRIESQPHDPKNEAWLQELLYRHPELLSVDAFDDTFAPAIPIGREVATDRGPIDNLYVSVEGGITVVETKLWKNPEKHRTVVAQVIDYAKEVATWDYDRLCSTVLASSRKRDETENASLEEKVAQPLKEAGIKLHEFQENVATCLAEGSFLLLIVGDRISPNIALLTKAIQSAPGLGFTLGLVEMQLYQMAPTSEWPLIVVPEVVGRTVEKTRGVVRVQYTQEKPEVAIEVEDGDDSTGKFDLDQFLRAIPKDLVEPYTQGIEEWKKIGGNIHFTNKMMYLEVDIGGGRRRVVRSLKNQVNVVRRKMIVDWTGESSLHNSYLTALEPSPPLTKLARDDKMWIKFEKLNADDLRVLLRAARELVQKILERE